MTKLGLTDDQWYSMTRESRATRMAHMLAREAVQAAQAHDD